jgi:hypothetical protein
MTSDGAKHRDDEMQKYYNTRSRTLFDSILLGLLTDNPEGIVSLSPTVGRPSAYLGYAFKTSSTLSSEARRAGREHHSASCVRP